MVHSLPHNAILNQQYLTPDSIVLYMIIAAFIHTTRQAYIQPSHIMCMILLAGLVGQLHTVKLPFFM